MSAAFILISSKVGDLIGRKRAYVLGLLRLRDRSPGDDAGPERDRDHHLLGDHRRARGVAAAARDAVPDPRELRGRGSDEDVRAGRGRCRDRCRGRPVARWLRDHVPLVACRLRARGRRDRGRVVPDQARPRRGLHGAAADRRGRRDPLGARHGRPRARHSRLAGRRRARRPADRDRSGRARAARLLARAAQAGGEADVARPGPVRVPALHDRGLRAAAAERDAGRRDDRAPDLPPDDARVQRDEDGIDPRAALAQHVRASRCSRDARQAGGARATSSSSDSPSARSGWPRSSRSCRAPTRAWPSSSRC